MSTGSGEAPDVKPPGGRSRRRTWWFGILLGGTLILVGTLLPRKPITGCVLTTTGRVAGLLPIMWTLVVRLEAWRGRTYAGVVEGAGAWSDCV